MKRNWMLATVGWLITSGCVSGTPVVEPAPTTARPWHVQTLPWFPWWGPMWGPCFPVTPQPSLVMPFDVSLLPGADPKRYNLPDWQPPVPIYGGLGYGALGYGGLGYQSNPVLAAGRLRDELLYADIKQKVAEKLPPKLKEALAGASQAAEPTTAQSAP
jgi:hypothetical protein